MTYQSPRQCCIAGCEAGVYSFDRCHTHYRRDKKAGLLGGKLCSVEGCTCGVYAKGLCSTHYVRVKTTGSPEYVNEHHGKSHSPEYRTWANMQDRCHNPKSSSYGRYGARGIYVCAEWRESFERFMSDMGPRPEGTSIERIDNNGPYCPTNCRWADRHDQQQNKSNTRFKADDIRFIRSTDLTNKELAAKYGCSPQSISRIRRREKWENIT